MKNIISEGFRSVSSLADKVVEEVGQRFQLVREMVNGVPFLSSLEKTDKYGDEKFDERHYFVVPFKLNEHSIALHSMRCLPEGIPEINDLPKRRVFHFPNAYSEALVQKVLVDEAKGIVLQNHEGSESTLTNLANDIDALDKRLTYGMLFVGGMAALANPVLGAGIAAKALTPGIVGLLSKYGLRPVGEKLEHSSLEKRVREAEKAVLDGFKSASTVQVVNPILQELELALNTSELEHDPLVHFDVSRGSINELDGERWRALTETAIYHVYKDILKDPSLYEKASLGPEDIRWLQVILSNKQ